MAKTPKTPAVKKAKPTKPAKTTPAKVEETAQTLGNTHSGGRPYKGH